MYYKIFKKAILENGNFNNQRLGDEGDILEIDETHIYSFKNHQGRILMGQKYWVVGLISRTTKEIRLMITRRRNQRVLDNFIRSNVSRGSIIFSDYWK